MLAMVLLLMSSPSPPDCQPNWARQLGDIRRDPPRFVFGEQLGARHRLQRQGQADRVETNLD
jgi:hypothetical protein